MAEELLRCWREHFPSPGDYNAHTGESLSVPGGSEVIVTWRLRDGYRFYVAKLYVDAAAGCTYRWGMDRVLEPGFETTWALAGNEHEFGKRLVLGGGSTIVLTVTNTSTADYDLDVVISAWARKVG